MAERHAESLLEKNNDEGRFFVLQERVQRKHRPESLTIVGVNVCVESSNIKKKKNKQTKQIIRRIINKPEPMSLRRCVLI